jgi:hypothetical protein
VQDLEEMENLQLCQYSLLSPTIISYPLVCIVFLEQQTVQTGHWTQQMNIAYGENASVLYSRCVVHNLIHLFYITCNIILYIFFKMFRLLLFGLPS